MNTSKDSSRTTQPFPDSLWVETAARADPNPPLEGDVSADVVVTGAGYTGLRAALELAEAGSRVRVLEAADVGWGASGRNGGQVNPMLPFNSPDKLRKLLGANCFERITDASLNSANELFSLIEKYRIDCQPRRHGWLRVNHSPRAHRESLAIMRGWNELGAGMVAVESDELRRMSGTSAYRTGVATPGGGAVQPLSLARGLARAAKTAGAQIHGQSAVTALKKTTAGWVVETATAKVTCEWVVLATNGYTDGLLKGLSGSVIPLVPIQIATDPLAEDQISTILPEGHTISDTRRIIMYARREPDNRMVFGGLGRYGPNGEIGGFDWLARDAARVFPGLKGVHWRFRWGGHIALTADRLPHLHEPEKGLIAGLGYNGRGVAMSHVMGRVLAERVLGAQPDTLPFPTTRIERIPFRGIQMMGKGMAIGCMRFLDFLETRSQPG